MRYNSIAAELYMSLTKAMKEFISNTDIFDKIKYFRDHAVNSSDLMSMDLDLNFLVDYQYKYPDAYNCMIDLATNKI